jgi:hypothetical protein
MGQGLAFNQGNSAMIWVIRITLIKGLENLFVLKPLSHDFKEHTLSAIWERKSLE